MRHDEDLTQVLLDAARLKPGQRVGFMEDVRWLFSLRLTDWLIQRGEPLMPNPSPKVFRRLRRDDVVQMGGNALRYPTGVSAQLWKTLDADFCIGYGFDNYSHRALNYAHIRRDETVPAVYVQDGPMSLGSFAAWFDRKPVGFVRPLPGDALRATARVEWPLGKTRSVQAWLGVWFDRSHIRPGLLSEIEALPDLDADQATDQHNRYGIGSPYASIFMQYYGRFEDDEAELRKSLGFKPKGSPGISEEILFRSVCEIFGADQVRRRYRGRELGGLEIDVWVASRKLGFEYQGEQHFRRIAHWHGAHGFEAQQARDAKKVTLCKVLGYRIVWIEPGSDLSRKGVVQELRNQRYLDPEFVKHDIENQ